MVKNSDVLFGRTAATYQFVKREDIKMCVVEVSTSRVLGLKKHIAQVMYERGLLSIEQIFAVYYSMIRAQQIKKIRNYRVCQFTFADDEVFYEAIGGKTSFQDDENFSAEEFKKKFAICVEDLNLCIDIQAKLENSQIKTPLLNILFHKKILSDPIKNLIPNVEDKIGSLNIAKGFDSKTVKKSIAVLINQIAIVNNKMSLENAKEALTKWEGSLGVTELSLKYLEVCFYCEFLKTEDCQKIASFLKKVSGIEYSLRFDLICLSDKEQQFFEKMREEKQLKESIVDEGLEIQELFAKHNLSVPLSHILILKGNLKREAIAKKWADSQRIKLVREMADDTNVSATVQATVELPTHEEYVDPQEFAETEEFEKELDETFRTSQSMQKQALQGELQKLRERLKSANPIEMKTINTILGHYQKADTTIKKTVFTATIVVLSIMIGIFIAYEQAASSVEDKKNPTKITEKPREKTIEELLQISRNAINKYQFLKVYNTYLKIISQNKDVKQNGKLSLRASEFRSLGKLITSLKEAVNFEKKVAHVSGHNVYIEKVKEETIVVNEQNNIYEIKRNVINPTELLNILFLYSIDRKYPWEMALFCYEYNLNMQAKKMLVRFVTQNPTQENIAWKLMSSKTGIPIPEGGYVVYQDEFISQSEYNEIQLAIQRKEQQEKQQQQKQQQNVIKKQQVPPLKKWENKQKESLRKRRALYAKMAKQQGYVFFDHRWTLPQTVKRENEMYDRKNKGFVWFNGEWHVKKNLGNWSLVTLRKEMLSGYLLQNKDTKLYTLRTTEGVRYLSSAQILRKVQFPSPWETYLLVAKKLADNNIQAQYQLGLWCLEKNLELPAQIQFEKVISLTPNHRAARKFLGFTYSNSRWYWPTEKVPEKVLFAQQWLSKLQARYYGLVEHNEKMVVDFSILDYQKPSQHTFAEKEIAQEIFGGKPQRLGKRWKIIYNFSPSMNLGPWENVTRGKTSAAGAIINEYLEVSADASAPAFAHLHVPFTGKVQVKFQGQIAPRSKYNLYAKVYHEDAKDNGGYLFALNWRKSLQDKNSQNIIQCYQDNQLQILASTKSPTIPSGKNYKIHINAHNGRLSLNLSGGRLLNVRENKTYQQGGVSFGTFDSRVRFDDITVIGEVDQKWFTEQVALTKLRLQEKKVTKNVWVNGIPKSLAKYYTQLDQNSRSSLEKVYKTLVEGDLLVGQKLIEELYAAYPRNPFILLSRARLYNEMKNYTAAIKDCSDVIQILKDKNEDELYTVYVVRGIAHNFLQHYKDALQDYLQAQTIAPEEFLTSYLLCSWHLQNNDIGKAQSILKTYIGQDPENKEAKKYFSYIKEYNTPYQTANYKLTEKKQVVGDYLENVNKRFRKLMQIAQPSVSSTTVEIFSQQNALQKYLDSHLFAEPKFSNFVFSPQQHMLAGCTDLHNEVMILQLNKACIFELVVGKNLPVWLKEGMVENFAQQKISLYHYFRIKDIIRTGKADLNKITDDELFYGTEFLENRSLSYAWVYFLLNSKYEKDFKRFLYETLRKGKPQELLAEILLQEKEQEISNDFMRFWNKMSWK
ncbi:tetratricopeptide repeat protein [Candidatus Uabimicrobium amorphum]|uniref:Uncharacterized protein n=1 Tax=Uabimicrobium amorphum TaxID=2596890 RepID=A0A5S9IPL7_UABAM|nr:hypothetical protein [Candidatus Uabimicrobium amorphum]BBM85367.1 hypothetical protein UABAM_03733 [Candidatus Uabimicrobium amorphum]